MNHFMRILQGLSVLSCFGIGSLGGTALGEQGLLEIQRFDSVDAHQGVGVGPHRVYAIGSRSISAHDKLTGTLLKRWKAKLLGPFIHLDSGFVRSGKLYCAHSNFPFLPMTGSVEVFDAATLEWESRHEFKAPPGSCTWVVWHDDSWWACFAHYNGTGGEPTKDNSWTTLVRYSGDWVEENRWRFPKPVLDRFGSYSCSGGSWGPDGNLYCTGHDASEVYVLKIPDEGDRLELVRIVPLTCFGQGIAWDLEGGDEPKLYSIKRRSREVIVSSWQGQE